MTIYYAHSMHLYGSKQEQRDIALLESMGFDVINPGTKEIGEQVKKYREKHGASKIMEFFNDVIDLCDGTAFRAHPDGKIGSGVWYELEYTKRTGKFIFELPSLISTRVLSQQDTVEYLKLMGER